MQAALFLQPPGIPPLGDKLFHSLTSGILRHPQQLERLAERHGQGARWCVTSAMNTNNLIALVQPRWGRDTG